MKKMVLATVLLANLAFAQTSQDQKPEDNSKKVTTKDAKKSCKEEGKAGAELIKCMKEKKGEK